MKSIYLLLLFCIQFVNVFGQNEDKIWHFGTNGGGMIFDQNNSISIVNGFALPYTFCGSSVVTDPSDGTLLFYTDGIRIYDAGHVLMFGAPMLNGGVATHSSGLVVKDPGNCNQYYVFTINTATENGFLGNLYYTKVDMSLPGNGVVGAPKGEVISGSVDVLLQTNVGEGLQVVPIPNSHDYWLVSVTYGSSLLKIFRINSSGIQFISNYSPGITLSDVQAMRFNPQGTKFFMGSLVENEPCVLLDFDPNSGNFSNSTIIPGTPMGFSTTAWAGFVDAEWSSDGTKLYMSKIRDLSPSSGGGKVYQYDLTNPGLPPFLVYNVSNSTPSYVSEGLRRGPDDKIYHVFSNSLNNNNKLGVVNFPNLSGSACSYNPTQVSFTTTYGNAILLPYFLSESNSIPVISNDTIVLFGCGNSVEGFFVLPEANDSEGDELNFNLIYSGAADVSISQDTVYYSSTSFSGIDELKIVFCDDYCNSLCDSVSFFITMDSSGVFANMFSSEVKSCQGDTVALFPSAGINSIIWSNGSISPFIVFYSDSVVTYSGVSSLGCSFGGTINASFHDLSIDLGPDTALCHSTSLLISNSGGENVLWSTGDTTNFTQLNSTGYYWVQVTDSIGCSATDSVFVTVLSEPIFDLGPDRFSCPGAFVNETIQVVSGVYDALWSDGNTSDSMVVQSPGWIWLTLSSSNGCQSTDSLLFSEFVVNESILGPDTVFCEDVTPYTLSTQLNAPQWSTGAQTQNISVSTSGTYWVEAVDENACEVTDSITLTFSNVAFNPLPDSSLATCTFVILDAGGYSGTLSWNNGQSSSSVLITQNGWYYVTLDNGNCTFSDSTFVLISNAVDFSMIVPNVFSPNGDGVNDYFEIPVVAGECEFDLDVIIYDRWGLEMYRSVNNTVHWDGKTIEGKKCPAGVYTVILQFQIGEESKSEIFHLTLIR